VGLDFEEVRGVGLTDYCTLSMAGEADEADEADETEQTKQARPQC